ncbi:hypothetical protein [Polaribacter cellanae]|uniref:hypothetical protein n=1 Tax=Polaribacter cellanae TaxID=2818493 RepID=UPI001FB6C218|nr:hypothetical protein [Polaribacter cellanae]
MAKVYGFGRGYEFVSQELSQRRNYMIEENFNNQYKKCFNLMNMIIAFRKKIK